MIYLGCSLQEVRGNSRIDIEACSAMKMIVKDGDYYCLKFCGSENSHPLPDLEHTTITNPQNWDFPGGPPPEPIDVEILEAPHAGPYHPHSTSFDPPREDNSASLAGLSATLAENQAMLQGLDSRMHRVEDMEAAIYNWHLHQHLGQFQPLPS